MAAMTTSLPENTNAALPIKQETIHFAVVFTPNPAEGADQGKPTKVRHTSSVKDINELKGLSENGQPLPDGYKGKELIAFEQDVIKPSVGTLEGFEQLVPDADERLNIINKGVGSKFNQKIRTALIEQNEDGTFAFPQTASAFDATQLVQEAAQRSTLSPQDKAIKALSALTPEMQQMILAQFAAIAAQQQGA